MLEATYFIQQKRDLKHGASDSKAHSSFTLSEQQTATIFALSLFQRISPDVYV